MIDASTWGLATSPTTSSPAAIKPAPFASPGSLPPHRLTDGLNIQFKQLGAQPVGKLGQFLGIGI
jgi:hypothetical protein